MRVRASLSRFLALTAVLAAPACLPGVLAAEQEVSITVLPRAGGAWVERLVPAPTGPPRLSAIGLPPSLDPSSLRVEEEDAARGLPLRLEPPLAGYPEHLQRCRGEQVSVLVDEDGLDPSRTLRARLVQGGTSERAVVRLEDGRLLAVSASRVLCDAGDERPGQRWWLSLPGAVRDELRLVYRLDGWGWRGSHQLRLGEDASGGVLAVEALVTVPTGVREEAAHLRLVAGDLPSVGGGPPRPMLESKRSAVTFAAAEADSPAVEESRGQDLLIFDLAEPVALAGPSVSRLPLRDPEQLEIEDVVRVQAPVPHHAGRDDSRNLTGRRHLRFDAPEGKPIPAGIVGVGQRRADGRWLPLGEATVPRTAPGEQADLTLGEVGDLVVRWRLTAQQALGNAPYRQQVEVRLDVRNPRPKPCLVELVQPMGGAHEVLEATPSPATKGGSSVTWRLELASGASETVRLRARVDPRRR
jgi:hypothetical protein